VPPQHQVLQEISGNHRKQPHLTPAQRLQIIPKSQAGCSVAELVAEFQRNPSIIRQTIHNVAKHSTTLKAARTGCPPTLSLHQKKIIYRKARAVPKIEYSKLAEAVIFVDAEGTASKTPSHSTLYRGLKERGLANYHCKKRPKLNCGHTLKHLQFCRQYRNFQWGQHQTCQQASWLDGPAGRLEVLSSQPAGQRLEKIASRPAKRCQKA
jgi:hypothetical protein